MMKQNTGRHHTNTKKNVKLFLMHYFLARTVNMQTGLRDMVPIETGASLKWIGLLNTVDLQN